MDKIQTPNTAGETASDRTIYTITSLVFIMILSLLLGSRFARLRRSIVLKRSLMSLLVVFLYILVFIFIIVSDTLVSGQGLHTESLCMAGTWVCLCFYTLIKATIYTFFVERIHVVRAPFVNRRKDKIYLACMAMIALMYSCVAINAGINHVVELKDSDGRCYFGIRAVVAVPFVVVNFFTDAALTAVFVYLLRPVLQKQGGSAYSCMIVRRSGKADGPTHGGEDTPMRKNIRNLLWKSIIGSLLIEISSAANMVQIIATKGDELGMICMTICLVDVFWDVLVIHWLLFGLSGSAPDRDPMPSKATFSEGPSTLAPGRAQSELKSQLDMNRFCQDLGDLRIGGSDMRCNESCDSVSGLILPERAKR
ncbi:hypothetical protein ACJQWK_05579 [Exserohilum turcicum]